MAFNTNLLYEELIAAGIGANLQGVGENPERVGTPRLDFGGPGGAISATGYIYTGSPNPGELTIADSVVAAHNPAGLSEKEKIRTRRNTHLTSKAGQAPGSAVIAELPVMVEALYLHLGLTDEDGKIKPP